MIISHVTLLISVKFIYETKNISNMKVYISIVSHGHSSLIKSLGMVEKIINKYNVVIKSNKEGDDFSFLNSNNFHWINDDYYLGFGHNNNCIYKYCEENLGMKDDDFFIVVNPDVLIESNKIERLISIMAQNNLSMCAINLYKDSNYSIYDNSVRSFPNLIQFILSFLGMGNSAILDKSIINKITPIDWASGSFLAFNSKHYGKLLGFDERYFMYCEDIDICWRSKKQGVPVIYIPDIKAIHLAKHANRNIFSKHFYWHFTGVLRFLFTKIGLGKPRSSIYFEKK